MDHAPKTDETPRPPPAKARYQLSLAWLLILTTCFGLLFTFYSYILPVWPSEVPMLWLFLLWTAAIIGQNCFLVWGACVRGKEQAGRRMRILYDVLWSLTPTGLWLAVIISLAKGIWARDLDDEIGAIFAVVAAHIAPVTVLLIIKGVKAWQRAEPLPSRMTYWSLAVSYAMPLVAVVLYIVYQAF
jgi:hypothetical protein